VALLADNIFVIALMPFLYCTIENFITGTLGLERYSICTAYILNRLSPQNIKLTNYYAGFLSFLGICGMLIMVWAYKKRRVEYSENNYKK
jgi:ABC-type Fe3+ transport system permease subunit